MCYANMISAAFVKARKPHRCWGCRKDIQPGEKYSRIVQKDLPEDGGTVRQVNWCAPCESVIADWGDTCYDEGCVADWRAEQESWCTCGHWIDDHCDDDGKSSKCDRSPCTCEAFKARLEKEHGG